MNVALCYPSVLPRKGGCETYIARLAGRLALDGHEVHLYASCWDETALPAALRIHRIDVPLLPRFARPWYFSHVCRRLLARGGHDVSLGFDKIAGVDVYYPQGGDHDASVEMSLGKHRWACLRRFLRSLKRLEPAHLSFLALERAQYRRPGSLVVAISGMVRRHLIDRHGLAAGRVALLPIAPPPGLTIASQAQRRQVVRRRWGLAEGRVVALFAAMNYRLKGLEPLLHALARLQQAPLDLVVAGQSSDWAFRWLARRLGVAPQVHFVGYCPDMCDAYSAADLLVHPTFYDPCSNVVLEALACGLPVITTRRNGAGELLHPVGADGTCREGYLLDDPHDHDRLAWSLEQMLDATRRGACARAAAGAAAGWTFEDHYQGLLRILSSVDIGRPTVDSKR